MARKRLLNKEEVCGAINKWLIQHGVAPTIEELRRSLQVGSTRTILRYLRWLEEEGEIERWPGARGLRLLKTPQRGLETRPVPVVGQAPAGPLMPAEENYDGWVRLPRSFCSPSTGRFFLLRVRGDSMNRAVVAGDAIENGDLVLVRQQPKAQPGEIVVAVIDGEATIKRLAKGPGYYLLKPHSANPKHEPIVADQDFMIQGVVVRVLKKGWEFLHGEA